MRQLAIIIILLSLSSCSSDRSFFGNEKNNETATDAGNETPGHEVNVGDAPEDSTGTTGGVSILFGTHIGNPPTNLLADPSAVTDNISVTSAEMYVHRIKLKANEKPEGEDAGVEWSGPYKYDLINGVSSPEIPKLDLADGTYKRFEFIIRPSDEEAEGDLGGNSLVVKGTVTKGDDFIPFSLDFENNEIFRIISDNGLSVVGDENQVLVVEFDMSAWFATIDVDSLVRKGSETIVISKSENQKSYNAFRLALKQSARLGFDKDGDAKLGDDEKSPGKPVEVDGAEFGKEKAANAGENGKHDDNDEEDEDEEDEEDESKSQ